MRPDRIARLDRFVAKPLCALLSGIERLRSLRPRAVPSAPRRMLFVKLIEMGSTVLACPAFAEAEKRVGRDNLFILVFASNRAILDVLPYFPRQNVIAVDDRNLVRFAWSLLSALARIRRLGIDTAIDAEGLASASAAITYLTGARRRVGFHNFTCQGPYRGRLFTHELNYTFQHHVSRSFVSLVRAAASDRGDVPLLKEPLGAEAPELPAFVASPAELEAARALTRLPGRSDGGRIVLFNPNCSDLLPLRRWPSERFVELGRRLLAEDPELVVAVTGAASEVEEARAIGHAIDPERAVCLAGRTDLRQLLALYSVADLLVSNDSGPVHFAALTPIRVIALYGPETPLLYGPLGSGARALTANLACSPCVNLLNHRMSPCTDNQCMQRISVDRVLAEARELLGTAGSDLA